MTKFEKKAMDTDRSAREAYCLGYCSYWDGHDKPGEKDRYRLAGWYDAQRESRDVQSGKIPSLMTERGLKNYPKAIWPPQK